MDHPFYEIMSLDNVRELNLTERLIGIGAILVLCIIVYFVCKKVLIPLIRRFTGKTSTTWDDHLFNDKVLSIACVLLPVLVAYVFIPFVFRDKPVALSLIDKICLITIIIISVQLVCAFISSFQIITSESEALKKRPLKGLYQMMKVVVICVGVILGISVLLDKEPSIILTGLGASAAIMMLVFKDSIMGLVAGVLINVYDMLRPGDWIVMEKHGVNGIVTEVTLNIVKIRNWDNTIVTVPTYALVSESFQNWRGMWDAGGRRISETINIDISSIRTCDENETEKFKAMAGDCPDTPELITNLFFFRYFMENYLKTHPLITPKPHLMVRQRPASAHGLPVEIYCFTTKTEWTAFEHVKAEIMEFAYASPGKFGLKAFQTPSGSDILTLKN